MTTTTQALAPVLGTVECDGFDCDTTVAHDIGDGWIRVITRAFFSRNSLEVFCLRCSKPSDMEATGEVDLLS